MIAEVDCVLNSRYLHVAFFFHNYSITKTIPLLYVLPRVDIRLLGCTFSSRSFHTSLHNSVSIELKDKKEQERWMHLHCMYTDTSHTSTHNTHMNHVMHVHVQNTHLPTQRACITQRAGTHCNEHT